MAQEEIENKKVVQLCYDHLDKFTDMKEKILNESEILSIKRLRAKKVPYEDIADRIGISVERVKAICGVRSK